MTAETCKSFDAHMRERGPLIKPCDFAPVLRALCASVGVDVPDGPVDVTTPEGAEWLRRVQEALR